MNQIQHQIKSPLGPIYLVASESGLQGIYFQKQKVFMPSKIESKNPAMKHLNQTEKQLNEYFSGKRKSFSLSLHSNGTDFQKQVWSALDEIPYGLTCSYSDIAEKIKNKKASRAVGTANGKNPFCIVVPCHRVVAANGGMGGYSAGLKIKKALLELEAKYH